MVTARNNWSQRVGYFELFWSEPSLRIKNSCKKMKKLNLAFSFVFNFVPRTLIKLSHFRALKFQHFQGKHASRLPLEEVLNIFLLITVRYLTRYSQIINIIIHSKYFSVSDWQKSHTLFIVTSYCEPNLEEFCDMWTDDVHRAAKMPDYYTVNWENLETRLRYKMAEHFTHFTRKK